MSQTESNAHILNIAKLEEQITLVNKLTAAYTALSKSIQDAILQARQFSIESGVGPIGQEIVDIIERAIPAPLSQWT